MQVCQHCGRTYPGDSQRFCTKCGTRLVTDERVSSAELIGSANSGGNAGSPPLPPSQSMSPRPDPFAPLPDYNQTVRSYQQEAESHLSPDELANRETEAFTPLPTPSAEFTGGLPSPPAAAYPPVNPAGAADARAAARFDPAPPSAAPAAPPLAAGDLLQQVNQSFQEFNAPSAPASTPLPPPPSVAKPSPPKSHKGLIIGAVAGLLLLLVGGAAVLLLVVKPQLGGGNQQISSGETIGSPQTDPNGTAAGDNSAPPRTDNPTNTNSGGATTQNSTDTINNTTGLTQPPDTKEFVNARAKLDGDLSKHYVEFAFYYPQSWTLNPQAGTKGATNFADLGRKTDGDFILENLAVSWYESQGTAEKDNPKFPDLVKSFSARLAKNLPNYRLVNEGATTVNSLSGYEFRFEGTAQDEQSKPFDYWGRVVFLPPGDPEQKNGVTLLMLANSKAPELKSVSDVGVKGDLPLILNSFRFR